MKVDVSIRRNVEQIKHCAEEALSVIVHEEDAQNAVEDLSQAKQLIEEVIRRLTRAGMVRP
jgi:hypothetical protein